MRAAIDKNLIGKGADAIGTPALVADLDAVNRNLQRMSEFAARRGLRLRPQANTHKSAAFALLQMQSGAAGLSVRTISEAEALAAHGIRAILIAGEVLDPAKLRRVAALAQRLKLQDDDRLAKDDSRLAIVVDSAEGVERLAQAMQLTSALIDVFIEVDIGQSCCGVPPGSAAVRLARLLAGRSSKLRYAGLYARHGSAQRLRLTLERGAAITQAAARMQETVRLLQDVGLPPPRVTGGGTGAFAQEAASGLWDEIQPGSYLFMDADYLAHERDPAQPQLEPALYVKAQVISVSARQAVCDAGSNSLALDRGQPRVIALPGQPELLYENGGGERGILRPATEGGALPALGDTVWLLPGHCGPTVSLHEHYVVLGGGLASGTVLAALPVDVRGG
ncbi:MAG: DSD1 family PLP-dependent enzyme [Burkholderiaceae bacterium]|nr:DSD1 family PLP-dependent enzyme [Burkholderiaceae bacterium]